MQETIRALEEQLEAKAAVESMAPPYMDLDFLDEMDDDSSSVQSAATGDLITEFSSAREAKVNVRRDCIDTLPAVWETTGVLS